MAIDIWVRWVMLMPLNFTEIELHFNKFLFDGKNVDVECYDAEDPFNWSPEMHLAKSSPYKIQIGTLWN